MNIATRAYAVKNGLRQYFDGRPCKHGNVAMRTTSNRNCTCHACKDERRIAAAERRKADPESARAADRARYAASPDRKKKSAADYYRANAEIAREKRKKRALENPEKTRELCRQWRLKNPDYERNRYASDVDFHKSRSREWRIKNPERLKEKSRRWRQSNPDKHAAIAARRRAATIRATPRWLTAPDIDSIASFYSEARRLGYMTGVKHHVDHIVPLRGKLVCGLHVPWNLQVIPANDNIRKSNKFEVEV